MSQISVLSSGGGGSGNITLEGNTGGVLGPASAFTIVTDNTTVLFSGLGTTLTQDFGLSNLVLGSSLPSLTVGVTNVGIGEAVLFSLTSGSGNVAIGWNSLSALTSGAQNGSVGAGNLTNLISGVNNFTFGNNVGIAYTTNESDNILIQNDGVIGDNNTLRIGTQGSNTNQIDRAFIAGIAPVSVSNMQAVTIDTSTGQLGSIPGVIFTLKSSVVDATSASVQSLFVSPSYGTFVVTSIVEYGQTVTGVISPATYSIGWTAPNYDDLSSGGTQVDTTNLYSISFPGGSVLPTPIPPSTTVSINVTVAGSATNFDLLFYVTGYILF